jgi:hypothetical protein
MAESPEVYVTGPDGQEYRTGGDTLRDYLANGYTVSKNQPNFRGVPVRLPDGSAAELDPQRAEEAIRSGGADVIDRGTLLADQERQVFGGGAGQTAAAAAGLARGATLGLSDVVAGAIDPTLPAGLRQLQEANPATSTATEMGGNIASLLATGGGAGLGSLATRGAVKLGAVEGGLAARALAGAAVGAAEMGAIEAGRELSQATLQERETSAARVAEAFGHGALLGGAFGGALPLAGAAFGGVASGARRAAGAVTERLGVKVAEGESFVQAVARQLEDEFAAKSVGAMKKQFREFTGESFARTGAKDRAVEMAQEMALQPLERKVAMNAAAMREAGERITAAADTLSAAGVRAEVAPVVEGITAKAASFAERSGPQFKAAAREAETWVADLRANAGDGDVKKLLQFKRDLGGSTAWDPRLDAFKTPAEALKRDLYHQVDDLIVRTGESTGDDAFRDAWRAANRDSQAARWIKGSLDEKLAGQANRAMGLSEQIGGAAGFVVGGGLNPVGLLTAAAGAGVQRLIKSYGADVGTLAARAFRTGDTKVISSIVDSSIAQGVGKMLSGTAKATNRIAPIVAADAATRTALLGRSLAPVGPRAVDRRAPPGGASPQQTAKIRATIEQSAEQQRQAIGAAMAAAPPEVAATLRGQLGASERATTYLLSKIPLSGNQKNTLTPQAEAPRLTKAQLDELVTAARVVADPLSVLESLERGTLQRTEVEALRVAAPGLYQQIRTEVQTQLSTREEPLPYRQALQLSQLLGVVGHPSLSPASIQAIQASYAPPAQSNQPAPPVSAPKRPISTTKDWSLTSEEP